MKSWLRVVATTALLAAVALRSHRKMRFERRFWWKKTPARSCGNTSCEPLAKPRR